MISVQLRLLAERLGKNISQIAEETGLNRNTITALYHEKVDGIKFATLEKICELYKVKIDDLLVYTPKEVKAYVHTPEIMYKQEGAIIPFTMWAPHLASSSHPKEYFPESFGTTYVYYGHDYGYAYWSHDRMMKVADAFYKHYGQPAQIDALYTDFLHDSIDVQRFYKESSQKHISFLLEKDFLNYFRSLSASISKLWRIGMYIDAFDAGFDVSQMRKISSVHGFSLEDVSILTTPDELTLAQERLMAMLEIVKLVQAKKIPSKGLTKHVLEFVTASDAVNKYKKDFHFHKSNYANIIPITNDEIVSEVMKYLREPDLFREDYQRLKKYSQQQQRKIEIVLKKHRLKDNPLYFFKKLTYWREYRKRFNLMGVSMLFQILHSLEERTGIALKYLAWLSLDEVGAVLKGLVTKDTLEQRYNGNMLVIANNGEYKLLIGEEATSVNDELVSTIHGEAMKTTISGAVASQGYAKAVARVILDQKDFSKLNEGEVLVSGMTRPDFLPLMKKASAIVTNEGGITGHAAIMARELGKPCIIGTQVATQLIHDGDLVEVRAYHGTVRILERAK